MSREKEVANYLQGHGFILHGPVVRQELEENRYFAFIEVTRTSNNLQDPSNAKIRLVQKALTDSGISIEFVLVDGIHNDIEAGVRATVLFQYNDKIRNAFISTEGKSAYLWLVPKRILSEEEVSEIGNRISANLSAVGLNLAGSYSTSEGNLPSKLACLSVIRLIAPADLNQIVSRVREKGFTVPSQDWMARMLDNLRKSGLVVRLKNSNYVLSLEGLKVGGTAKNSRSPDVSRMLDLARRRV